MLYPIVLCDLLLRLADAGAFRPVWSALILDEMERNLGLRLGATRAKGRRAAMEAYFEEALQQPIRDTDKVPECVEADDRHVVATALSAGSELLVTLNLSDIPPQCLIETVGLKVESPDEFLCGLLDESDFRLQQTLLEQAEALKNPPLTPLDILDLLSRLTPGFANRARILFTETAFG